MACLRTGSGMRRGHPSPLNRFVASGEEVLSLVRSGKVDWDG